MRAAHVGSVAGVRRVPVVRVLPVIGEDLLVFLAVYLSTDVVLGGRLAFEVFPDFRLSS